MTSWVTLTGLGSQAEVTACLTQAQIQTQFKNVKVKSAEEVEVEFEADKETIEAIAQKLDGKKRENRKT